MRYVGVDLHKRHLTVHVLGPQGQTALHCQVSTAWNDVQTFFLKLAQEPDGRFIVVMENCGFHHWLVKHLLKTASAQVLVITAPQPSHRKTDKRDAKKLAELLWLNRDRIATGQKLLQVSVVYQPTDSEQQLRDLTQMRCHRGRAMTRVKNSIKAVLRRHNLEQECPTKGLFTKTGLAWLPSIALPEMDRHRLNMLLDDYRHYEKQIQTLDRMIDQAAALHAGVPRLRTIASIGNYTALALLAHIGPIARFKNPRSLSNFFGLTPGCRNSGETRRPGSITKAGHPFIRFLLAQMVLHALRRDPGLRVWYREIKRRRGSRIARVAVMRRLCEMIWHMLSKQQVYRPLAEPQPPAARTRKRKARCAQEGAASALARRLDVSPDSRPALGSAPPPAAATRSGITPPGLTSRRQYHPHGEQAVANA